MPSDRKWYEEHAELVAFFRAVAGPSGWDVPTLLYALEKPWKWDAEHVAWRNAGKPADFDISELPEAS